MTDERYVFRQTERERKRLSRGAYGKKNGSKSKKCTLPSDMMSKAQREAMNGEMKTYNLSMPMTWNTFKEMPNDLQKEYLLMLTNDVGAGRTDIADMFGIGTQKLSDYLLSKHKGEYYFRGKKRDQEAFLRWYCGEKAEKEPEDVVSIQEEVQPVKVEEVKEPSSSVIEFGKLEFCGSAKEIFEKMMRILDGDTKYRVRIGFEKE